MLKKLTPILACSLLFITITTKAQKTPSPKKPSIDTALIDYDELFNELDHFLDSLYTPRSFFIMNVGFGSAYFVEKTDLATPERKMVITPALGYYHKSGLGLSGTAAIIRSNKSFDPYQFSLTGSYDYIKNFKFISGISFTHFFTSDSLSFYTPPLQNELYSYFTYKKFWLKPMLSVRYGWGSRSEYQERQEVIKQLKKIKRGNGNGNGNNGNGGSTPVTTTITTEESINDLSVAASVRHDFYWLAVLRHVDFIRLTPQLSFTSGTQGFGFNQTINSYAMKGAKGLNILYNTENNNLSDNQKFQPLSLTFFLRSEIAVRKFSLQPQIAFDCYLPGTDNKITTSYGLNAGFTF